MYAPGDNFTVGYYPDWSLNGIEEIVAMSYRALSGNNTQLGTFRTECFAVSGGAPNFNATFQAVEQGKYTLFWNITYNISTSSQVNSTSCGPGPWSLESWLLNSTFQTSSSTTTEPEGTLPNTTMTVALSPTPSSAPVASTTGMATGQPTASGSNSGPGKLLMEAACPVGLSALVAFCIMGGV